MRIGPGTVRDVLADLSGRTGEELEGIQETGANDSGYALRIPRFKRLRSGKSVHEADTPARLEELHEKPG